MYNVKLQIFEKNKCLTDYTTKAICKVHVNSIRQQMRKLATFCYLNVLFKVSTWICQHFFGWSDVYKFLFCVFLLFFISEIVGMPLTGQFSVFFQNFLFSCVPKKFNIYYFLNIFVYLHKLLNMLVHTLYKKNIKHFFWSNGQSS